MQGLRGKCGKILLSTVIAACSTAPHSTNESASPIASSQATPDPQDISWASMGTVWRVRFGEEVTPELRAQLRNSLVEISENYDSTFSDWNEQSELRRLEKLGLASKQGHSASQLFLEGLSLSREAYELSHHKFDITVGALLWKASTRAIGLNHLHLEMAPNKRAPRSFRFDRDPLRLTFGGIAKGMCVGRIAQVLWLAGVRNFQVNGGGGNLFFVGDDSGRPWAEQTQPRNQSPCIAGSPCAQFVSRSRTVQGPRSVQHIFDPQFPERAEVQSASLSCSFAPTRAQERSWTRWGALSDAFSKALILDKTFQLPANCLSLNDNEKLSAK